MIARQKSGWVASARRNNPGNTDSYYLYVKSYNNPFFKKNSNFDEAVPFDLIKTEHFLPAIEESIKIANLYIQGIADSSDSPTFDNTVIALENSSEHLENPKRGFIEGHDGLDSRRSWPP